MEENVIEVNEEPAQLAAEMIGLNVQAGEIDVNEEPAQPAEMIDLNNVQAGEIDVNAQPAAEMIDLNNVQAGESESVVQPAEAVAAETENVLAQINQLQIDVQSIDSKIEVVIESLEKVMSYSEAAAFNQLKTDVNAIGTKMEKLMPRVLTAVEADNKGDIQFDLNLPAEGAEGSNMRKRKLWDKKLMAAFKSAVQANGGIYHAKPAVITASLRGAGYDICPKQVANFFTSERDLERGR